MNFFKKTLKIIAIVITIAVPSIYIFLFTDSPFPAVDEKGLVGTESENIPPAQAILIVGDSVSKNIHVNNGWF